MPVIDIGVTEASFRSLMRIQFTQAPLVPFPELPEVIGPGRLIAELTWPTANVTMEPASPADVPGTVLLRSAISLRHLSIAELDADANAAGQTWNGDALVRVRAAPGELRFELAGVQRAGEAAQMLQVPQALSRFALPAISLTDPAGGYLVRAGDGVFLRLLSRGGSRSEFTSSPLPPAVIDTWSIHVPKEVFLELVLEFLSTLDKPEKKTFVEGSPSAVWVNDGGVWGVNATGAVLKKDACPGLFGDVDVSVDLAIRLRLRQGAAEEEPDLAGRLIADLRVDANASDWDSFRCWAGNLGLASYLLNLNVPPLGIFSLPEVIVGLAAVGSYIAGEVSDEVQDQSVDDFRKTGGEDEWAEFRSVMRMPALPIGQPTLSPDETGLIISANGLVAGSARHQITFTPDAPGPLFGEWQPKIDCGKGGITLKYAVGGIAIEDTVLLPDNSEERAPVIVFPSSTALPKEWSVDIPWTAQTKQTVTANGVGVSGPGKLFVHSTAGLKRYDIAMLPRFFPIYTHGGGGLDVEVNQGRVVGLSDEALNDLVKTYCASFHVPSKVFERTELKWVEPPPSYSYGIEAIKQWQVIVQNLTPGQTIAVHDESLARPREVLAARADGNGVVAMQFETAADAQPVLVLDGAPNGKFKMLQRWLVPVEEVDTRLRRRLDQRSLVVRQEGHGEVVRLQLAKLTSPSRSSMLGGRVEVRIGNRSFVAVPHRSVTFAKGTG